MDSSDTVPDVPEHVDITQPSAARAYDYFLGGAHNFAVDRAFAEQVLQIAPSIPAVTLLNRSFLRRAVRYCLAQGITQFLDLGSGIPTVGNTHQIAESTGQPVRTVYVDQDTVAYHHARWMLREHTDATILHADMRDLHAVLNHPDTERLLDLSRPLGLLVVGVALYLPDPQPAELIAAYRDRLASGSLIALSTLTDDHAGAGLKAEMRRLEGVYAAAGEPVFPRTHAQISGWFDGLDLVDPGLVTLPEWHGEEPTELDNPARPLGYGCVARVP